MFKIIKQKLIDFKNWLKKRIYKVVLVLTGASVVLAAGLGGDVDEVSKTKLAEKYNNSTRVKQEYQLKDSALIKHTESINDVKVVLGDEKAQEFKPEIEISRWDEVSFRIKPDVSKVDQGKKGLTIVNGKVNYTTPDIDYEMYEEGENYKYIWYLKKKPASNIVSFEIESQDLDFYYQPPLNEEMKNEKCWTATCTAMDCCGSHRPEDVVGSYAVYHSTKGGLDIKGAEKQYKVGKVAHIYRPKLIDSNDWEVWGDLHIDAEQGIYRITIPQDFLDKAVYPIKSNDTFGNTDIGGTLDSDMEDQMSGLSVTPSKNGKATKVTAYCDGYSHESKIALYKDSDDSLIEDSVSDEVTLTSYDLDWHDYTLSDSPIISSSFAHNIVFWAGSDTGGVSMRYDHLTDSSRHNATNYTGTFPSTTTFSDSYYNYSMYVTYDPAAQITTSDVTNIASTSAKFNAELDIGVSTSSNVYWEYGTSSSPLEVNYTASTTPVIYTASTTEASTTQTGLTTLQIYNNRAMVTSTDSSSNTGASTTPFITGDEQDIDETLAEFETGVFDDTFISSGVNIELVNNGIVSAEDTEDFEVGMGDWSHIAGSGCDGWTRDSGGTPSGSTGPDDGQENDGSAYYVYLESSSGYCYDAGDEDYIEYTLTGSPVYVDFYYHMYGADMGTLAVDSYYSASWHEEWSISGEQHTGNSDTYTRASTTINSSASKIRFRGVNDDGGYLCDMAVDVIEVNTGEDNYSATGTWISEPVALTNISNVDDSIFYASSTVEGSTTSVAYYSGTNSNTSTPSTWNLATSGQAMNISGDQSSNYLFIKASLSTSDTSTTPYFKWQGWGINDGGGAVTPDIWQWTTFPQ